MDSRQYWFIRAPYLQMDAISAHLRKQQAQHRISMASSPDIHAFLLYSLDRMNTQMIGSNPKVI